MSDDAKRLATLSPRFDVGAVLECWASWTTCRAVERGTGRALTLTVVDDARLESDTEAQRFMTEARQLEAVESAQLIPVVDAGVSGGTAWIAQAASPGASAADAFAGARPDHAEVARLGEQVAGALDAVHAAGILHRDLRLEHVVQLAPGSFRLGGFGVGRYLMAGAARTDGTPIAGLPAVLAPEVVTGGAPSVASDIHALGSLLYELVTGVHPFAEDAGTGQLERLVRAYALRPSAIRPDVPPALEEVILRALAKDPASRFLTADAMRKALAVCPGGSGAPAHARVERRTMPTWAEMLTKSRTFAQRLVRAAGVLAPIVLAGAAAFYYAQYLKPRPPEDLITRARREAGGAPRDTALRVRLGHELARAGLVDEARRLFQEALAVDPASARAMVGLGTLQEREGRPEEARTTYRKAVTVDARAWYAVLALVANLEQDGRRHEARVMVEQALAANPGQPELTQALARLKPVR